MNITAKEFKEVFGLDSKCTIPKETLSAYTKQIKGSYLLYKEILNIDKLDFKNVDGTKLKAYYEPYNSGWQNFVDTLGSKSKFYVSYYDENRKSTIPFWTYTKYKKEEVVAMKDCAYNIFKTKILLSLNYKYSKYGFSIKYRDLATNDSYYRTHPNQSIWWDGIEFNKLFYRNGDGNYLQLCNYRISDTITNRKGIWNEKVLEPIQKIIDSVEIKTKSK